MTINTLLGFGLFIMILSGCGGLSNAPVRSFVQTDPPVDGLSGKEWKPQQVPAPKPGVGTAVSGFDFEIRTIGPQRVVRGNNLIFLIQLLPKLGTLAGQSVDYSYGGLPFEWKVKFPVLETSGSPTTQTTAADHFGLLAVPLEASMGEVSLKISATINGLTRTAEHPFRVEPLLKETPIFSSANPSVPPIPYLENFKKILQTAGAQHCPASSSGMNPNVDGIWTWDGLRAYEVGSKFLNSPEFTACANQLRSFIESQLSSRGFSSRRIFTLGLESAQNRQPARTTADALAQAAQSYTNLRPQASEVLPSALGAMAMISATRQRVPVALISNPWLLTEAQGLDVLLGHVDQILISQNSAPTSLNEIAILLEVLIDIYATKPDPRIPHYLWAALERLWTSNWIEKQVGLISTFPRPLTKTVNLDQNLAIAGAYAWLYQISGAPQWIARADALFEGGVRYGTFDKPEEFSSQMRFSADFIKWRGLKPLTDWKRAF